MLCILLYTPSSSACPLCSVHPLHPLILLLLSICIHEFIQLYKILDPQVRGTYMTCRGRPNSLHMAESEPLVIRTQTCSLVQIGPRHLHEHVTARMPWWLAQTEMKAMAGALLQEHASPQMSVTLHAQYVELWHEELVKIIKWSWIQRSVAECLPSTYKALSSNPRVTKKKKKSK